MTFVSDDNDSEFLHRDVHRRSRGKPTKLQSFGGTSRPSLKLSQRFGFGLETGQLVRSVLLSQATLGSMLSRELHALLLLPLVAEPDSYDVLLQVEFLRDRRDLLAGRPRLHREIRL